MRDTGVCPKCGGREIVRVPDNPRRYSSGNNIYLSVFTLRRKIPVIRYVCAQCGYVENWVEKAEERKSIRETFG